MYGCRRFVSYVITGIFMTLQTYLHPNCWQKLRGLSDMGIVALGARIVIGDGRVNHGSLKLVVARVAKANSLRLEQRFFG
jgi:hypothetical protein